MDVLESEFLVIGAGIAGLSFALRAAKLGKVNVLLKDSFQKSSTQYAQGGINAVLAEQDSFESHTQDTLDCGYGLCDEAVVRMVVERGPEIIEDLMAWGTDFTRDGERLSLHREGGHAHNRVVHAKDATGAEIMRALIASVRNEPNITIFPDHMAIDLIFQHQLGGKSINENTRCIGAYVLESQTSMVKGFVASVVYLATGGIGKVYPYTSNPRTATGDGIAMAYRAGIEVENMEFIQFHPTILYHHEVNRFLITEATRGEGGILRDKNGRAFMADYHPRKELAPRDVVARAIDREIKQSGNGSVFLDLTHLPKPHLQDHFPNIYDTLFDLGIDISVDMIPVVPAAHYLCGGLRVDQHGRTRCAGLFAGGECSNTGLHGANRLASNSLLEAAVYAKTSFEFIEKLRETELIKPPRNIAPWVYHETSDAYEETLVSPLWKEVRQFMWNYVGIVRTNKRLDRAIRRIEFLRQEIETSYWNFRISKDLIELRNISIIAELIIRSAAQRKESRGLHYNVDHPETLEQYAQDTCLMLHRHGLFR
ncbi:L-aspartate oxidase [Acanthopleuribacter pedis]|uniref:L-aspartate oxidase n=1 Tax=Acanthopleuribacter pedis TaxID=442870 RepID=A0A8J7QNH0_9BACT|nr:L-aspartate oxidase [Acanthopleuribacter pedis]MBO1321265.1 L-aspartate oxidase [Acanthopleuribacter pedis]